MREGVIVRLHVRRWRAKAKLDFADLGLPVAADDARTFADLLHLGEKRLLPGDTVKELEAIESAGRKCLERHAFTTFWGPLVAVTDYEQWENENAFHRNRYLDARDRLIRDYEATVEGLLIDYERAARAAYRRLNALAPEQMTPRRIPGRMVLCPDVHPPHQGPDPHRRTDRSIVRLGRRARIHPAPVPAGRRKGRSGPDHQRTRHRTRQRRTRT